MRNCKGCGKPKFDQGQRRVPHGFKCVLLQRAKEAEERGGWPGWTTAKLLRDQAANYTGYELAHK